MSRGNQESLRNPDYHLLVGLLSEAWERSELSESEICRRLGRPNNYLNKIEKGLRRIDVAETFQLCGVIGVDPMKLLAQYASKLKP